ncbi:Exopolygalacturonase [Morella rubra]|uniref:Exopolygalacturonase n=1 Tax=Morella rubra TaxID=262757 RepID=A0A6A1V764_9ROSI|nr:Exopolygalacturonase [Morella rubra]
MALKFSVALISSLFLLASIANIADSAIFDVTKSYGAKTNGDIAKALTDAWKDACAAEGSNTVVVPKGTYQLSKVTFPGPCNGPIGLQVSGTLVAPGNPGQLKDAWITFLRIDQFTLSGGGVLDGNGESTWKDHGCDKSGSCGTLPTSVRFDFLTNSVIQDITSLNSKNFHFNLLGCESLTMQRLTITAPETSPNTDGIHMGRSSGITITDVKIATGDDCISIGDGSENVTITKVTCGPGHGISIGSLGKYQNEEPVRGITVTDCTFLNTQNGVRIKTWPASPSSGIASNLHFESITMTNVQNPILIDQEYCPYGQCKAQVPSKIKISDVTFKDIKGTSAGPEAVKLACSKGVPCENVSLSGINLKSTTGEAQAVCRNVKPKFSGTNNPPPCK